MTLTPTVGRSIALELTEEDLDALLAVAHHYERVMGFARHVVVATSRSKIRRRYRHIVQESDRLEALIRSWHQPRPQSPGGIGMSVADGVAIWGRILSSLNTKRSRRKLSVQSVSLQKSLSQRLASEMRRLSAIDPELVETELTSRRRREREWMQASLDGQDVVH